MRSDLPEAVAAAIARCSRPALVFDRARLVANMRALVAAARTAGITPLFAAKSFPHPAVWELAAEHFEGFDAASGGELHALPTVRVLSIADPSGRAIASAAGTERLIVSCETVEQVRAAPTHAEIAIRISASVTGRDPAIGAVLDGSGHRRSRFGVDTAAAIGALAGAAGGRPLGLHVHHGPITATSSERFLATARAALAAAAAANVTPRFLDLGGAWHGIADLAGAFTALRAALPTTLELIVEPGRALVEGAGFACGQIVVVRALADRSLAVVDLSRICHLRWSQVELVGTAPHPGAGWPALVVGPTCFEEDVLGEWSIASPGSAKARSAPEGSAEVIAPGRLVVGARVVLRHVTGYAVAWNTGFGGVPPADVIIA